MADAMWSKSKASSSSSGRQCHSSDPLEGTSSQAPAAKKKKTAPSVSLATSSKEDQRKHKAIEKAFLKAQSQVHNTVSQPRAWAPSISQCTAPAGDCHSIRELSPNRPASEGPAHPPGTEPLFQALPTPEALQAAPAALGLPTPQPQEVSLLPEALELITARAIKQGLSQCRQQGSFLHESPDSPQSLQSHQAEESLSEHEVADSPDSADHASIAEADDIRESVLSDDEGLVLDQPPFIGLFRPQSRLPNYSWTSYTTSGLFQGLD